MAQHDHKNDLMQKCIRVAERRRDIAREQQYKSGDLYIEQADRDLHEAIHEYDAYVVATSQFGKQPLTLDEMKRIEPAYVEFCHKKISDAVAIVQATGNEKQSLWEEFAIDARLCMRLDNREGNYTRYPWKSDSAGYFAVLGNFGGAPVCISIDFSVINNRVVVFWHATPQVVHHGMIEEFFKSLNPKATTTDAGNFVNILHEIEERNANEAAS